MEKNLAKYGPLPLRVMLGVIFLMPGVMKLLDPGMPARMLAGLGFPAATAWAWLLIAVEIVGGVLLLVGWKIKYAVWPLMVILLVATVLVHIPSVAQNPQNVMAVLFHVLGVAGLLSLFFTGAGAVSIE